MSLSPEETFYMQLAYLQMSLEQREQMADEVLHEMRRREFEALMQNNDFIESLEQMKRGEGIDADDILKRLAQEEDDHDQQW